MADAPSSTSSGSKKSSFGFLAKKIGPVPIWLIAVGLVAIYYWYEHYGPGASSSSAAATAGIDPVTGASYASELGAAQQQISDLQSQQSGTGGGSSSGSSSSTPTVTNVAPPITSTPTAPVAAPAPPPAPKPAPTPVASLPKPTVTSVKPPIRKAATVAAKRKAPAPKAPAPATRWRATKPVTHKLGDQQQEATTHTGGNGRIVTVA